MKVKFPNFDLNHNLILQELEVQTVKGLPELKILGLKGQKGQILKEKLKTALKVQGFKLMGIRKIVHIQNFEPNKFIVENLEFQLVAMLLIKLKQLFIPTALPIYFVGKLDLEGKVSSSISEEELKKILQVYPNAIFIVSADYCLQHPNIIKVTQLKQLSSIKFHSLKPVEVLPLTPEQAQNPENYIDFELISEFQVPKFSLVASLLQSSSLVLIGSSGIGKTLIFRTLPSLGVAEEDILAIDPSFTVSQFKNMIQAVEVETEGSSEYKDRMIPVKVIILNELADYKKSLLEYLKIFFDKIDSKDYKHKYLLLASLNPCQCGNLGNANKQCKCNFYQLKTFQNKIQLPLLDRFGLVINLNTNSIDLNTLPALNSFNALQLLHKKNELNQLNNKLRLSNFAQALIESTYIKYSPSKRRLNKILELANTIAFISGSNLIEEEHVSLALDLNSYIIQKNALN